MGSQSAPSWFIIQSKLYHNSIQYTSAQLQLGPCSTRKQSDMMGFKTRTSSSSQAFPKDSPKISKIFRCQLTPAASHLGRHRVRVRKAVDNVALSVAAPGDVVHLSKERKVDSWTSLEMYVLKSFKFYEKS